MKLFENGVGRPSNEIKKKRRIFILSITLVVALMVGLGAFLLNSYVGKARANANIGGTNVTNIAGDLNDDGKITESDANILKDKLDNGKKLTMEQTFKADFDSNGGVNNNDYCALMSYLGKSSTKCSSSDFSKVVTYSGAKLYSSKSISCSTNSKNCGINTKAKDKGNYGWSNDTSLDYATNIYASRKSTTATASFALPEDISEYDEIKVRYFIGSDKKNMKVKTGMWISPLDGKTGYGGATANATPNTKQNGHLYYSGKIYSQNIHNIYSSLNGGKKKDYLTVKVYHGDDNSNTAVVKIQSISFIKYKSKKTSSEKFDGITNYYTFGNNVYVGYFPKGDVDLDGFLTEDDAKIILRASAKLLTLNDSQKKLADYDGDGNILAKDARTVLRIANGLEKQTESRKKACLSKDATGSGCKWAKLTPGYTAYPVKANEDYFLLTLDESGAYSPVVDTYVHTSKQSDVESQGNISITKHEKTVKVGDDLVNTINSTSKIKEVKSSDKNVIRVRELKSNNSNNKEYIFRTVGVGKASVTITDDSGKKATFSYNVVERTKFSPDEVFGTGKYKTETIGKNYSDNAAFNVYYENVSSVNGSCKNAYMSAIKDITNHNKYKWSGTVRKSVTSVYITSTDTWQSKVFKNPDEIQYEAAGVTFTGQGTVFLRCYQDYNTDFGKYDARAVTYHEFGHAIDGKYKLITGKYLSSVYTPESFVRKIEEKNKTLDVPVLTERNNYAFTDQAEFFAQLHTAYAYEILDGKTYAERKKWGLTYGGESVGKIKDAMSQLSTYIYNDK